LLGLSRDVLTGTGKIQVTIIKHHAEGRPACGGNSNDQISILKQKDSVWLFEFGSWLLFVSCLLVIED